MTVTSLSSLSGSAASNLTISGSGFSATPSDLAVFIGNNRASIVSSTLTSIEVDVEPGHGGRVTVENLSSKEAVHSFLAFHTTSSSPKDFGYGYQIEPEVTLSAPAGSWEAGWSGTYPKTALADFNNDGKLDIVRVTGKSAPYKGITVYENTSTTGGGVSFASTLQVVTTHECHAVLVFDVNLDGKLDLIALQHFQGSANNGQKFSIFLNTSTSSISFASGQDISLASGDYMNIAYAEDFDLDGRIDIGFLNGQYSCNIKYLKNTTSNGVVSFASSTNPVPGTKTYRGMAIGDLNGDSKVDIIGNVSGSTNIEYYRNTTSTAGSPTFAPGLSTPLWTYADPRIGVAMDFNGDGNSEAVLSGSYCGGAIIESNYSSGTFLASNFSHTSKVHSAATFIYSATASDLNGDGLPDVAVTNSGYDGICIRINTSTTGLPTSFGSTFTTQSYVTNLRYDLQAADLNGDGFAEIVEFVNTTPTNSIVISSIQPKTYQYTSSWREKTDGGTIALSGSLPTNGNLEIKANLVTSNLEGVDLRVDAGKTLTVPANTTLNFTENLTNSGSILLQANATGYAQLKFDGTLTNTGSIQQTQYVGSLGHHAIASSMASGFTTTNGATSGLYAYDASSGAYSMSPALNSPGTGYFAIVGPSGFQTAAGGFSVTGDPTTSHTHVLGYSSSVATGGSGAGWNLIGNPYSCSLDWTTVMKTNVNDAIYIWDPSTSTYKYYVNGISAPTGSYAGTLLSSGTVPPLQAFWVQANSASASLSSTMAENGTVSSTPTFYKQLPDNIILTVQNTGDTSLQDALWIRHEPQATKAFEGGIDAWKMTNSGNRPSVFSTFLGEHMAVNAMDLTQGASVPIGFSTQQAGVKFKLDVAQLTQGSDYPLWLEDLAVPQIVLLDENGYVFESEEQQSESPRFVLHIGQRGLSVQEGKVDQVSYAYQSEEGIHVVAPSGKGDVELIGMDGRVLQQVIMFNGMAFFPRPESGLYLIRFTSPIRPIKCIVQ